MCAPTGDQNTLRVYVLKRLRNNLNIAINNLTFAIHYHDYGCLSGYTYIAYYLAGADSLAPIAPQQLKGLIFLFPYLTDIFIAAKVRVVPVHTPL